MRDSWHRVDCTHCDATNWIQEWGDESDPEDEACSCWSCHSRFWLVDKDYLDTMYGDDHDIQDAMCVLGEQRVGGSAFEKNLVKLLRQANTALQDRSMVVRMKLSEKITKFLAKLDS